MSIIETIHKIRNLKLELCKINLRKDVKQWLVEHPEHNHYCKSEECPHSLEMFKIDSDYWPNEHVCKKCVVCEAEDICSEKVKFLQDKISSLEDYKNKLILEKRENTMRKLYRGNQKVVIFDVDGTLTPHAGQDSNSLFYLDWESYSIKYKKLAEISYLEIFMDKLLENNFIILYASMNTQDNILELFNHFGIIPDDGISRESYLSKQEYIDSLPNHNTYYYFEDDFVHLNMKNNKPVNKISCMDLWLGSQLRTKNNNLEDILLEFE